MPPPGSEVIKVTVDTGAATSVTKWRPNDGYERKQSKGSIAGQRFGGPGGEKYHNRGEVTYRMIHRDSG